MRHVALWLTLSCVACGGGPKTVPATPPPSAPVAKAPDPPTAAACLDKNNSAEARDHACMEGCNERHGPSCVAYGDLEVAKEGGSSIWAYDRACAIGEARGCEGRDKHIAKLRAECQKPTPDVCSELAEQLFYMETATEQHLAEAVRLETTLCNDGHGRACVDLGRHYAEDKAVLDKNLARKWYDKACELKEGYGCCGLYSLAKDLAEKKAIWARAEAVKGWCTQPAPNGNVPTPP